MPLELSRKWSEFLIGLPESGMGYQRVWVRLRDGRIIRDLIVLNAQHLIVGRESDGFQSDDILEMGLEREVNERQALGSPVAEDYEASEPIPKRFTLSDLPWAASRIIRKIYFRTLPLARHQDIMALYGWVAARNPPSPDPVRENLTAVLGGNPEFSDLDKLVRLTHAFFMRRSLIEIIPNLRGFEDPQHWSYEGIDYLDRTLKRGRGALLVTANLGYALLLGSTLRKLGYPVSQVLGQNRQRLERARRANRGGDATLFRHWVYERTRIAADFLDPVDIVASPDVRPILQALATNRVVIVDGDSSNKQEVAWYPLLGRPYPFSMASIKLALITGSAVLPSFVVEGEDRHVIELKIGPEVDLDPQVSVADNTRGYARALDLQLRETVYQWAKWRIPYAHELWGPSAHLELVVSNGKACPFSTNYPLAEPEAIIAFMP